MGGGGGNIKMCPLTLSVTFLWEEKQAEVTTEELGAKKFMLEH